MTAERTTGTGTVSGDRHDTMTQVSTLQTLMLGDYYGTVSMADVKAAGDIGLGTFDAFDGEMVMVDGVVWQAKGDGSVVEAADDLTTPFCCVTPFETDETIELGDVTSMDALKETLSARVQDVNPNAMWAVRIDGTFASVTARSEPAQSEPYRPLQDVMENEQVLFDPATDVSGTLVGIYFPDYLGNVNTAGWHFHFVSDDRSYGGHVMAVDCSGLVAQLDKTDRLGMVLPEDCHFDSLELMSDLESAIANVEGGE